MFKTVPKVPRRGWGTPRAGGEHALRDDLHQRMHTDNQIRLKVLERARHLRHTLAVAQAAPANPNNVDTLFHQCARSLHAHAPMALQWCNVSTLTPLTSTPHAA